MSGLEKGVFWKRGLFRKVHCLETLEYLGSLEILENAKTVENKGESDHLLEILEEFRHLRDSRDSSSEKTPFVTTPFSSPENGMWESLPWVFWNASEQSGTADAFVLDIFECPYGAPPTHGVPKPPSNTKWNSKKPENPDYLQKWRLFPQK